MAKNTEVAVVKRHNSLPATQETAEQFVVPPSDVYETGDGYVLVIDLPGATKGGINVTLERNVLVVKASVEPYHTKGAVLLQRELQNAGYYRAFNLGDGIDRENVDASLEDGVLTIRLFKSERLKPKEIRIA